MALLMTIEEGYVCLHALVCSFERRDTTFLETYKILLEVFERMLTDFYRR